MHDSSSSEKFREEKLLRFGLGDWGETKTRRDSKVAAIFLIKLPLNPSVIPGNYSPFDESLLVTSIYRATKRDRFIADKSFYLKRDNYAAVKGK